MTEKSDIGVQTSGWWHRQLRNGWI